MVVFIAISILYFPLIYSVYALNKSSIYAENGVLENIQVAILILSFFVFLMPVFRKNTEGKLIFIFFSLLCVSFFLREVDVEDFDISGVLIFIGSGIGRNLILLIGFTAIAVYGALDISYYRNLVGLLFVSRVTLLMIIAGTLLVASGYFEERESILHHEFLEEMFELSGYIAFLLSALALSKNRLLRTAT